MPHAPTIKQCKAKVLKAIDREMDKQAIHFRNAPTPKKAMKYYDRAWGMDKARDIILKGGN